LFIFKKDKELNKLNGLASSACYMLIMRLQTISKNLKKKKFILICLKSLGRTRVLKLL